MKIIKQKSNTKYFIVAVLFLISFSFVQAQSGVEGIKSDISEKQQLLDQLNDEIQSLQKEISAKQKQAASLKNEVALFDLQILQTERQITAREVEIDKLSSEIDVTEEQIIEKELEIQKQKRFLGETLRLIYEFDSITPLEMTIGNDTFSAFLDQVQYASNLQERNQEIIVEVRDLKAELEQKQEELKTAISDQEAALEQLALARAAIEVQRGSKQSLLNQTRGQESIYQGLLSEVAEKQEQVGREIFDLEVALRKQLGDPTLPPVPGFLQWPTSGVLTQGYGNTGFTSLGYSFHNGLDIAAAPGTRIIAAGDGIVFATGTGQTAYGNWIVLKHTIVRDGNANNIYTLYAHLQGIGVSVGQTVKGGDLIGFMGNSGNTTRLLYGPERGYHLHFTIFDEKGFNIKEGNFQDVYGPYQIPVGVSYNPLDFLQ